MVARGLGGDLAGGQVAELLDQALGLRDGLALDVGRHHRGRGLADGARVAGEGDLLDAIALHVEGERDVVAAHRVVAFGLAVGVLHRPEVAGLLVVLQDHFLVELLLVGHYPKIL
ncbi:hypothetical protein D3C87_1752980 [compost metagenome]